MPIPHQLKREAIFSSILLWIWLLKHFEWVLRSWTPQPTNPLQGHKFHRWCFFITRVGSSMKTLECSYKVLLFDNFSDVCWRKDPKDDRRMQFKSDVSRQVGKSDSETNAAAVHLCNRAPVFSFLTQNFEFSIIWKLFDQLTWNFLHKCKRGY